MALQRDEVVGGRRCCGKGWGTLRDTLPASAGGAQGWGRGGGQGGADVTAEAGGSISHPLTAAGTSAFSSLQGGWGAFVCLAGALESGGKGEWQRGGERCRCLAPGLGGAGLK